MMMHRGIRWHQRLLQVGSCRNQALSRRKRFGSNATTHGSSVGGNLIYNRDSGMITQDNNIDDPIFHTVIGIEIHAQLAIPTKLFSSSPTKHNHEFSHYTDIPNGSVSAHDIGYPGTLPLLSKTAVQYAVISAAALQCQIQSKSRFERKHYFYADLPLGYQVTQQRWPLAKDGVLTCRRYVPPEAKAKQSKKSKKKKKKKKSSEETNDVELSKFFSVGIDRIQIEQDTGKTTTVTEGSKTQSLIDFNRAGCALIEVVFKPQIKSAHEAASVASTVQSLLKHIETCDGKMEDGSIRVDLNISIAPTNKDDSQNNINTENNNPFQKYLPPGVGNRVEVKNLNSVRQIIQSVEYEGLRQARDRLEGGVINQETRTFDPKAGITLKIRDKGGAVDYRFMPEPDLPPLILNEDVFNGNDLENFLADRLPELPEEAILRLMDRYGIAEDAAIVIASDRPAIAMYEEAVRVCINSLEAEKGDDGSKKKKAPIAVSNWLCNDLFALVKESATKKDTSKSEKNLDGDDALVHPISMEYSNVNADRLGMLLSLVLNEVVSTTQGKKLLDAMYKEDLTSLPKEIADKRGWKLISDPDALKQLCRDMILDAANQKQLEQYKQGGKHVRKMKKFFVGKIMAASKGNAHPELLLNALDMTLDEIAPGVE
jgi:aspartyl-tRNA(Asn)/glutamyl-tRNA(Gln) amidotransferase subunit B